jgi:hypothetical protein
MFVRTFYCRSCKDVFARILLQELQRCLCVHFIAGVAKILVCTVFVDSTSSGVGTGISATLRDVEIHVTSALATVFCH